MSVRVLSWVFEHSPVQRHSDLLVLLALADHAADDGGGAYPSAATLGRKARLSERRVFSALGRLKAGGDIKAEGRVLRPTKGGMQQVISYRVVMTKGVTERHTPAGKGGDALDTKGVTERAKGGDALFRETVLEPSIEPSVEARAVKTADNGYGFEPLSEILARLQAGRRPQRAKGR